MDAFLTWGWPIVASVLAGAVLLFFSKVRGVLKNLIRVVGQAGMWSLPSGLSRRRYTFSIGESAYIASHPYEKDREVNDIVLQVIFGNGTNHEVTLMTFRLEIETTSGNAEVPVSEARWSEQGNQWILIPKGGGFSSVPQKDYKNAPIAVAALGAYVGWIGFCLLEGPSLQLAEAARSVGHLVAVLSDGKTLRTPLSPSTLQLV